MRPVSVAALACVLAACGQPSSPPVAPVVENAPAPAPAPQPPPAEAKPFPASVFPERDVQTVWKIELESLCASGDATIQRATFDITGDDKPEQICWRTLNRPPNGEYVDVVVAHDGATRRQSAYLLLPVHGGVQEALCPGGPYTVTPEDWDDPVKREFMGIPDNWPKLGLTVYGGQCDPVHLFWPDDAETFGDTGVLFYFARL